MPTRLIEALKDKTAEEQCDFIRWLVLDYAMCFTDSREAVIEWLKEGIEDGEIGEIHQG